MGWAWSARSAPRWRRPVLRLRRPGHYDRHHGRSGNYVNRYSYLPLARSIAAEATIANSFAFVGQYGVISTGSGLSYMATRFYSSSMGQFMSGDPLGLGGGQANVRDYVGNNPESMIDPTGLKAKHAKGSRKKAAACSAKPAVPVDDWSKFFPGAYPRPLTRGCRRHWRWSPRRLWDVRAASCLAFSPGRYFWP